MVDGSTERSYPPTRLDSQSLVGYTTFMIKINNKLNSEVRDFLREYLSWAKLEAYDLTDAYVLNGLGQHLTYSEFRDDVTLGVDGLYFPTAYDLEGRIVDYQLVLPMSRFAELFGLLILETEITNLPPKL